MSNTVLLIIVWFGYLFILLPLYIIKEKQIGKIKALRYKLALSGVFCLIGLCSVLRDIELFNFLVFIGLLFSFFGDYYLIFIKENELKFIKGITLFGITHVFYCIAMISIDGLGIEEFILTAVILTLLLVGNAIMKIEFGKAKIPLFIYSVFLTFMASKAFVLLICGEEPLLMQELFSIGAILFMISDVFLGLWRYVLPKGSFNYFITIPYFLGQLMIATAIFY